MAESDGPMKQPLHIPCSNRTEGAPECPMCSPNPECHVPRGRVVLSFSLGAGAKALVLGFFLTKSLAP